ncbi:MAG: glycosyltransferase family 39 protein [Anaerolineae bacterium]|nr:glycosyltransferase family 39 protein [Anaerolineae bacterium]
MARHSLRFWRNRVWVLAVLLVGAALRLWEVGEVPPGLYHDEAQHGMDALAVLQGNFPLYFTANNGREPLFIYLVTLFVGVLGRSPLAVRLPSFFIGFLTLAAMYDLAKVLWNRRVARWAVAVLSVTFWHVHLSRVGFRAILLPLFTALYLAQAARALRTGRARHWIAAGALYGASWYTYMAARFTPIALALIVGYGLLWHRKRALKAWRGVLLFCGAAFFILAPLGIYTLQYPDVVLQRTGQVSIFSPEINEGDLWSTLLKHTARTAGMFFIRGDRIWRHNLAWRPVWGPALGLCFVIGLGVAFAGFRKYPSLALPLLWTATMTIPTLLAEDAPHFLRGVGVLPTAAFFPALGLTWVESCITHHVSRITHHVSSFKFYVSRSMLPLFLLFIALFHTTYDYFVRYANAPLAYHWFEAGPVEMAGRINMRLGEGWDGERFLHIPVKDQTVYVAPKLWQPKAWTSVPFLVPESRVHFLPVETSPSLGDGVAFVVWPHTEWASDVLPYLPHPAYLSVVPGPRAQGDKDETPFMIALFVQAEPRPEVPAPVARFEQGIVLSTTRVYPAGQDVQVHLWWNVEQTPTGPYTVFVHYLRDGERIAQDDGQPGMGYLPTTIWHAGDWVLDIHILPDVMPDPARDSLRIGLYQSNTVEGLSVLDWAGNPAGGWVIVEMNDE